MSLSFSSSSARQIAYWPWGLILVPANPALLFYGTFCSRFAASRVQSIEILKPFHAINRVLPMRLQKLCERISRLITAKNL